MKLRDRIFRIQEMRVARAADRVVVHGETQRAIVFGWTPSDVIAVDLPGDTRQLPESDWENRDPFALCLGEVRPNKGIHTALEAAADAGFRLVVAGRPVPEAYGTEMESKAAGIGPLVDMKLGYLSSDAFGRLLGEASVILLPYMTFGAQSGILARAMQCKKRIISSDLPSLVEQAGDYGRIDFFPAGDSAALAALLRKTASATSVEPEASSLASEMARWDRLIKQVFD
ncbi:glycosyltransferase [Raineyella fluvialis]|nr:glycosyltransferase [Raineyella fluvialis]